MTAHRTIIEPGTADRNYWRDLWSFRGLFWFLAWRDILVRYKQTVIGIAWSVLRPLLTLGAMALIGWLFSSSVPDGVPRLLLVGAATLPWTFFSSAFSEASGSLISNSNLLTKVYFPRLIVPTSTVLVCLIDFLISFVILLVLMAVYRFAPGIGIVFLPLFLLLALITALGSGILIAALNVKYRDFRYVVPFMVQFGLYISP
ncbi:MAG: ABC transporter permease, partial [Flavobacteriales bacterium]